jgi:hypothetical protein
VSADSIVRCPACEDETGLREWYEIGMTLPGYFIVDYRAECRYCHAKFKFQHEQIDHELRIFK